MDKVVTIKQATQMSKKLREQEKRIVLAGGCFDILHRGHIEFLEKAKEQGNILMLLLESDKRVREMKGENRPINILDDRAKVLTSLTAVDYVIPLPENMSNNDYDTMINEIKPAIIATTQGDPNLSHKERQAKQNGCKVVQVTHQIANHSTTRLATALAKELSL